MRRILICYSHFSPAFKAGGPVQSLVNLVGALEEEFQFYVVCSAYEMGDTNVLNGIIPDKWNQYSNNVKVYYSTRISYKVIQELFRKIDPAIVYINGIFVPYYNWLPLYLARRQKIKIVLAPRGMLQKGALAIKSLKKKVFLEVFKLSGIQKNIFWHATDTQERSDIKEIFGEQSKVEVALNIPRSPLKTLTTRSKAREGFRLVYLSLIAEKKNLHVVLQALNEILTPLEFDIYGPVKDEAYWERCQPLMKSTIHRIRYQGIVNPLDVQSKLQEYHSFILPTRGENFGHAIFEAMSVGTVPIISSFTPWGNLQDHQAGITVNTWSTKAWAEAIQSLIDIDQLEYNEWSKNTFLFAKNYFEKNDFKSGYRALFE